MSCRCVNSSASQSAISSEASGLFSFGLKSHTSVSRVIFTESTSSPSFLKLPMSARKESDATDAGYSFAKLRNPSIAARRSSRRVDDVKRLERVFMVSKTDCFAGVVAIANIALSGVWSQDICHRISMSPVIGVIEEERSQPCCNKSILFGAPSLDSRRAKIKLRPCGVLRRVFMLAT